MIPPHIAFPYVTWAALEGELARELGQRRSLYPRRIDTGRMLPEEAEHELAVAAAWIQDVARMRARWSLTGPRPPFPQATHGVPWATRRQGLLRELALRRRFYPGWIDTGRLLAEQATAQLAALDCLLRIYEDGWDWRASDGLLPSQSPIALAEYRALLAEVAARNGTAQKELAL